MKHKTADLDCELLAAAVAKALGGVIRSSEPWEAWDSRPKIRECCYVDDKRVSDTSWMPSSDWEQAGAIIERESITIGRLHEGWAAWHCPGWGSYIDTSEGSDGVRGQTPLIAAMRAFVAHRFGEEVELP